MKSFSLIFNVFAGEGSKKFVVKITVRLTHAKPLRNRKATNTQKYWTNEDTMPTMPSINSVVINTIFLPFVSARHPHIYDPITIPAETRRTLVNLI